MYVRCDCPLPESSAQVAANGARRGPRAVSRGTPLEPDRRRMYPSRFVGTSRVEPRGTHRDRAEMMFSRRRLCRSEWRDCLRCRSSRHGRNLCPLNRKVDSLDARDGGRAASAMANGRRHPQEMVKTGTTQCRTPESTPMVAHHLSGSVQVAQLNGQPASTPTKIASALHMRLTLVTTATATGEPSASVVKPSRERFPLLCDTKGQP